MDRTPEKKRNSLMRRCSKLFGRSNKSDKQDTDAHTSRTAAYNTIYANRTSQSSRGQTSRVSKRSGNYCSCLLSENLLLLLNCGSK